MAEWTVPTAGFGAERQGSLLLSHHLTARETEVLQQLAQGKSNKEIGRGLGIAELTVKKHVASVIAKMGANNRSDAAVRAVRGGLVGTLEQGGMAGVSARSP